MRYLLAASLSFALLGCVSAPRQPNVLQYQQASNPAEYEPYMKPGTATVTGQAFMTTVGGDVKLCAGQPAFLDPVTAVSTLWWSRGPKYNVAAPPPTSIPEFKAARRVATCDAQGNFKFDKVPAGSYYLSTFVTWQVPSTNVFVDPTQGGIISVQIEVADGEQKSGLVLTR